MKPLRITFESSEGTLAIEFSRSKGELMLVALDGERRVVTGARAREIARKAIELTVLCAVASLTHEEEAALRGHGRR